MNYFLVIILVILVGSYVLDVIVDILNVRHAKTDLPEEFEGYYDAETYKKSQEYLGKIPGSTLSAIPLPPL